MLLSVTPDAAPNMSSIADLSQFILLNRESIPEIDKKDNTSNFVSRQILIGEYF